MSEGSGMGEQDERAAQIEALMQAIERNSGIRRARSLAAALLDGPVARMIAEAERRGAEQALRQAQHVWQWGEWANAPRHADRVQERIANGQHVTDWLRARADMVALMSPDV